MHVGKDVKKTFKRVKITVTHTCTRNWQVLISVSYLKTNCWLSQVLNGVIASFDISHKQQLQEVQLLVLVSSEWGALTHLFIQIEKQTLNNRRRNNFTFRMYYLTGRGLKHVSNNKEENFIMSPRHLMSSTQYGNDIYKSPMLIGSKDG